MQIYISQSMLKSCAGSVTCVHGFPTGARHDLFVPYNIDHPYPILERLRSAMCTCAGTGVRGITEISCVFRHQFLPLQDFFEFS